MNIESTDELISAALDGEDVDLPALEVALARPEGREALAAFVLLRAATAADCAAIDRMRPALRVERHPFLERRAWHVLYGRIPIGIAASLGAIAVAASFWLGTTWRANATSPSSTVSYQTAKTEPPPKPPETTERQVREEQPPTPSRRVHFGPGEWQRGS
jgi:negative regulator of sigma E activity